MRKLSKKEKPRIKAGYPRQNNRVMLFVGALLFFLIITVYQVQQLQNARGRAQQTTTCDVSATDAQIDSEEQKMLVAINAYRQQKGLTPLKISFALTTPATWLSNDMNAKKYLNHTDSQGRDTITRITDCASFINGTAENIADKASDFNTTLTWWKNSQVHNTNLLLPSFVAVGIARSGVYWTLDFATENPDDNGTMPSSPPTSTVPSPGCLGNCPTLPVSTVPTVPPMDTTIPTIPPTTSLQPSVSASSSPITQPVPVVTPPPAGGGGLIQLFLSFLALILQFFLGLMGGK